MQLISFEQIALDAGVSVRTVARDVKRRLLTTYHQGRKALIDQDATATAEYIASHRTARQAHTALGRQG